MPETNKVPRKRTDPTTNRRLKGRWSVKHDSCLRCKTTTKPHQARGYCRTCYSVRRAVLFPEKCKTYWDNYYEKNREKRKALSRAQYRRTPKRVRRERHRRRSMLRERWPIGGTVLVSLGGTFSFEGIILKKYRVEGIQHIGGWCLDIQGGTLHEEIPTHLCTLIKIPETHKRKNVPLVKRIEKKRRRKLNEVESHRGSPCGISGGNKKSS